MPKVEIELDSAGIQELLKSPEIASACESAAQKRTNATGVPYVPDVRIGKTRVSARGYEKKKVRNGMFALSAARRIRIAGVKND